MKRGKAVLVVAGLPIPFEGPWVPLRGKRWSLEWNPSLSGVGYIVIQRGKREEKVLLDGKSIEFQADRGRFVLTERIEGIDRLTVELVEVR